MTDTLTELVRSARALLIDFDGPVCSVFAGYPPMAVTSRLRPLMPDSGAGLPSEAGPHEALLYASRFTADIVRAVDTELRTAELDAVRSAIPTSGSRSLLSESRVLPRAIVSNNAAEAVHQYLADHRLTDCVDHVQGRNPDPTRMKPSPHPVQAAADALAVAPGACLLIGDAVTDILAACAAGARSIGYANKPGKTAQLTSAGADAIVTDVHAIVRRLRDRRPAA